MRENTTEKLNLQQTINELSILFLDLQHQKSRSADKLRKVLRFWEVKLTILKEINPQKPNKNLERSLATFKKNEKQIIDFSIKLYEELIFQIIPLFEEKQTLMISEFDKHLQTIKESIKSKTYIDSSDQNKISKIDELLQNKKEQKMPFIIEDFTNNSFNRPTLPSKPLSIDEEIQFSLREAQNTIDQVKEIFEMHQAGKLKELKDIAKSLSHLEIEFFVEDKKPSHSR